MPCDEYFIRMCRYICEAIQVDIGTDINVCVCVYVHVRAFLRASDVIGAQCEQCDQSIDDIKWNFFFRS